INGVINVLYTYCVIPAFLVAVNCWSVSLASRTQVILLIVKISALVLIIIPGIMALSKGQTENFENAFNSESLTLKKLPLAFYSGLYAFSGWFALNFVTEEVINPKRNIPLAIILSMVTVTILYVLVNVAYYTMMTADELLRSDTVAVTFTSKALPRMASLVPLLVAMSCLGAMNGGIFAVPRMLLVAAREGQCPVLFSMIHIRRKTPMPAVLLLSPLTVIMVAKGEIYQLINFASFSRWLFVALVTLGLVVHRYRFPDHPKDFKVPLAVPVIFTVVCFFIVGLSLYSDPWNTGYSLGVTFTGIPVYYLTVKHSYGHLSITGAIFPPQLRFDTTDGTSQLSSWRNLGRCSIRHLEGVILTLEAVELGYFCSAPSSTESEWTFPASAYHDSFQCAVDRTPNISSTRSERTTGRIQHLLRIARAHATSPRHLTNSGTTHIAVPIHVQSMLRRP
ncbi:cystine/glutamate transporter-like, partial [Tachysurus vachellii]|uniref:cystine/glutamate transporter-like n=1 Tax=Tachysurus vachellii TaxID=175792 RepID=UPI00296AD777